MNLLTSKTGWLSILTAVAGVLSTLVPVIPAPWGAIVTAVLGVLAFYKIGGVVGQARIMGAKGL